MAATRHFRVEACLWQLCADVNVPGKLACRWVCVDPALHTSQGIRSSAQQLASSAHGRHPSIRAGTVLLVTTCLRFEIKMRRQILQHHNFLLLVVVTARDTATEYKRGLRHMTMTTQLSVVTARDTAQSTRGASGIWQWLHNSPDKSETKSIQEIDIALRNHRER